MSDISLIAASVVPSAGAVITRIRFAGATILAGKLVYIDPADGLAKLADANGAGALHVVAGMALNGASAGQPVDILTSDPNLGLGVTTPLLVAGDVFVASATPGGIAPDSDATTGWFKTIVLLATSPSTAIFKLEAAGVVIP